MIASTSTDEVRPPDLFSGAIASRAARLPTRGVTKLFPGMRALDNVNMNIYPDKIPGIVGENGAGKTNFAPRFMK